MEFYLRNYSFECLQKINKHKHDQREVTPGS